MIFQLRVTSNRVEPVASVLQRGPHNILRFPHTTTLLLGLHKEFTHIDGQNLG